MEIGKGRKLSGGKGIRWFDWVIFAVLAIGCHLIFQQPDITHTAGASFAYLNGHITDFYSYTNGTIGGCMYMPTTYIIFAIWNLPLKLLGIHSEVTMAHTFGVLMWYTLLPILFYMGVTYLMWKVAREVGFGEKQARAAAYGFAASPLAFYSQFIFCQYDSMTLFFVMLGIYYYLKEDDFRFVLFFVIAITCKYYALLVFVPMLLLRQKNVWRILFQTAGAGILFAAEFLFYLQDRSLRENMSDFNATSYIFNTGLDVSGFTWVSAVIVLWAVICAYSFFLEPGSRNETWKWFLYLESLVMFCLFGLSMWHPQWLIFAVPFMVFGSLMHKRTDVFWLLDLLTMVFFVWFVVRTWIASLDENLLAGGVLNQLIADRYYAARMTDLPLYSNPSLNVAFSVISGILLINGLFKHPKYMISEPQAEQDPQVGLMRLRFIGGISTYVVPCLLCLAVMLQSPYPDSNRISVAKTDDLISMQNNEECHYLEQYMTPKWDTIERIDLCFGDREQDEGRISLTFEDETTGEVLKELPITRATVNSHRRTIFKFDPIPLQRDHVYKAVLSVGPVDDGYLDLYTVPWKTEGAPTFLDGIPQDFTASIVFYGR